MRTTNSGKERPRSPDLATDSSINLGWPRPSTRRFAFYPPDRKNGRVKSFPRPRKRGVGRRVGKIQRIRNASQHGLIEFPITDILLYTIIPNLWNYSSLLSPFSTCVCSFFSSLFLSSRPFLLSLPLGKRRNRYRNGWKSVEITARRCSPTDRGWSFRHDFPIQPRKEEREEERYGPSKNGKKAAPRCHKS